MPSIIKSAGIAIAALAAVASALPAQPKLTERQNGIYNVAKRQNAAAAAAGLTDPDILNFALTLEWLEATFYQQGFAQFPDSDFAALGLTPQQILDLKGVGASELAHVGLLQSAIAQAGFKPVQQCQYNFGFTDAAGMVGTAAVLENIGVSAYLGAAPLVSDGTILGVAASIVTVEGRHQSFIRAATGIAVSPSPLDTPLGPKAVFSLAAPFIASCPEGSNLALTAFPPLTMATPPTPSAGGVVALAAGTVINLQSDAASTATFCGFTNSAAPGGTAFTPFTAGTGCALPPNLAGVTYVTLTSTGTGPISDDITLAGPMVMVLS